jgi:hypothetical protein
MSNFYHDKTVEKVLLQAFGAVMHRAGIKRIDLTFDQVFGEERKVSAEIPRFADTTKHHALTPEFSVKGADMMTVEIDAEGKPTQYPGWTPETIKAAFIEVFGNDGDRDTIFPRDGWTSLDPQHAEMTIDAEIKLDALAAALINAMKRLGSIAP